MTRSYSTRTLSLLLAALLAAGALAGCATDDGGDNGGTTTTPGGTTPTGTTTTGTTPTGGTSPTPPTPSNDNDVYGLTSGSTGGVYYAIANGIQSAVRDADNAGFTISEVPTSGGSVTNVERLRADDYQLALMQNDVAYLAYHGEGQFEGNAYQGIRAVAALYPEMVQIVTLQEGNIQTLDDLNGARVAVGAAGSGVSVGAADIMEVANIQAQTQNLDLTTSVERLQDGGIDAFFWIGGLPTGAVTSLAATHPVRIVPIPEDVQTALREEKPFYASVTLPSGTYTGVDADVPTVAVIATLAARDDVPADDIAKLLEIIFDGDAVRQAHAQGANIQLESAFNGLEGIPFHPGAEYYYATKGLTPPS